MSGRKRLRLVPKDGVECFEVRAVLYLTREGKSIVAVHVDTPDNQGGGAVPLHEVLGVLDFARLVIVGDDGDEDL